MHMKGPFQLAAFAAAFLLFALPDSPGADLAPTVGGDALAQPGCTWDGTTLSCPRLDGGIDEFCDNPQNWGNSFCSYGGGYMMAPGKDNGSSGGSGGGGSNGGSGSSNSGFESSDSQTSSPPSCPAGQTWMGNSCVMDYCVKERDGGPTIVRRPSINCFPRMHRGYQTEIVWPAVCSAAVGSAAGVACMVAGATAGAVAACGAISGVAGHALNLCPPFGDGDPDT